MCGVPYRSVTSYVARLLECGHKVAIAEQVEDARRVKGLVHRDVVRIITPGTVVEDALLPYTSQNLLASIVVLESVMHFGPSQDCSALVLRALSISSKPRFELVSMSLACKGTSRPSNASRSMKRTLFASLGSIIELCSPLIGC